MSKPSFATLESNFPSPSKLTKEDLYKELGWDGYVDDPNWANTCAVRLSYGLIKSGFIPPSGRERIREGPYRGEKIEPGQEALSKILARKETEGGLGRPEIVSGRQSGNPFKDKHGIISFMRIPSYQNASGALSGHMDLLSHEVYKFWIFAWETSSCIGSCHWEAEEYWFWELK